MCSSRGNRSRTSSRKSRWCFALTSPPSLRSQAPPSSWLDICSTGHPLRRQLRVRPYVSSCASPRYDVAGGSPSPMTTPDTRPRRQSKSCGRSLLHDLPLTPTAHPLVLSMAKVAQYQYSVLRAVRELRLNHRSAWRHGKNRERMQSPFPGRRRRVAEQVEAVPRKAAKLTQRGAINGV